MTALRYATIVAIAITMILNAHHGFEAATGRFAILMAILYAILDVAKAAIAVAAVVAWQHGNRAIAILCCILFPVLFMNSLWNTVSQVASFQTTRTAAITARLAERSAMEEQMQRLSAGLAIMDGSPLYRRTAACADATAPDSKVFCGKRAEAEDELARLAIDLAALPAAAPEPAILLVAELTGLMPATIRLVAWITPVFLAELLGALGFMIAAAAGRRTDAGTHATPSVVTAPEPRDPAGSRPRMVWSS